MKEKQHLNTKNKEKKLRAGAGWKSAKLEHMKNNLLQLKRKTPKLNLVCRVGI